MTIVELATIASVSRVALMGLCLFALGSTAATTLVKSRVGGWESFAPVIGIMKVRSDEEAIALMNDSRYGLTAAIWTQDAEAVIAIGERVETGAWFMNRCDYLDPALAWTGVKDSGRGCTLSRVGYEQLTRPKSYHLRVKT